MDRAGIDDLRGDIRALPVFLQRIDDDPRLPLVRERVGDQPHFRGGFSARPLAASSSSRAASTFFVSGSYLCAIFGPMSRSSFSPSARGGLHQIGRLLLRIDLAGVRDERAIREIGHVIGGVVEVPELLLPPGRRLFPSPRRPSCK